MTSPMPTPKFYGVRNEPLSIDLGKSGADWDDSILGRLNKQNSQVFLKELPFHHRTAEFAWRITNAYWSPEDSIMTIFRAKGFQGESLPYATFGVTWNGCPHRISGSFTYSPEQGNKYFVPVDNQLATPNTGGYTVQILDERYPSEAMAFGIKKGDKIAHQALVLEFRLLTLGPSYPR